MPYRQRLYQLRAKDAAFETFESGIDSALLTLPTGCGKTILAAMIIEEYHAMCGRRSLFLAHRGTLIDQAEDKFTKYGLDVSVEMAGQDAMASELLMGKSQVVVGSVATMQGARLGRWDKNEFGLLIVDETHHITAKTFQNVVNYFNDKHLLGITATPKPELGLFFKKKCFQYTLGRAINGDGDGDEGGWLVPPVLRKCMISVDLRGLRTSGGDFNIGDLEERLYPVANEIADAVHDNVGGRQTVIFTPDCGTAQGMADLIRDKHKRTCEYVAGTGGKFGMPKEKRDTILERFERGEFQILVNCELLFEGWDCPSVKCVVNARPMPLKMLYRFIQMAGRGLRPAPETGFNDCLILDCDWQCADAARDLACVVDLFGEDQYSDEIMDEARRRERAKKAAAGDKAVDIDPREILKEAEEYIHLRNRLKIRINPDHVKVKTVDSTPVAISKLMDVKFKSKYDMDSRGNNPATENQARALREQGVNPDKISKWGASKLLKELFKRRDGGLATVDQVKALVEKGVDPVIARSLKAESAAKSLTDLGRMAAQAKHVQKDLF